MSIHINKSPTLRELRQFAGLWLVVFGVMGFELRRRGVDAPAPQIVWILAATVPAVGLVWTSFLRLVFVGMMYATYPIGWVVTRVILVGVYILVFVPIGVAMRLVNYDPMGARARNTYWVPRRQAADAEDYFRQY